MRRTVHFASASLLVLMFSASVFAEDATLSGAEHQTLEAFGASHPACSEWSDGCAVCARTKTETADVGCSLPGIACQPAAVVCRTPPVVAAPH